MTAVFLQPVRATHLLIAAYTLFHLLVAALLPLTAHEAHYALYGRELQLSYLKVLNCDLVQGLLFGEPMTADEYFQLLLTESRGSTSYQALFA